METLEYARDHPGGTPTDTFERERLQRDKDEPATKFLPVPPLPMGMGDEDTHGNKAPMTPELRNPSISSRPQKMLDDSAQSDAAPKRSQATARRVNQSQRSQE